ncbi:MAG: O-antigen ligase family protein [Chloroflexota bacterium]|nr:O-antigen ligase family protein [Chloroflexota bacterium]
MLQGWSPLALGAGAIVVLLAAALLARLISRWAAWEPAGPIALIAAAPIIPRVPLLFSLSLDDLLPLLGLGMLLWRLPVPRFTNDRILRAVLVAVAVATLARIASALVNGGDPQGAAVMLIKAVARPALLVGIAAYAAVSMPADLRRRFVGVFVASVGTFEAAFGLVAFALPLPGGAGIEAARQLTTLYGVCPGRISGTLGLSPNHLGAVFVVTLPFTVGQAVTRAGWPRLAWTLAAGLQVAALVLTFTRSSIVLGVVLTVLLLIYYRKVLLLALVTAVSTVLVFAVLSLGCVTSSGGHGLPADPGSLLGGRFTDGNDRLALWWSAGRMMFDHPIAGVGLGSMAATLNAEPERYSRTPFGPATSSAHNTILLAGAETGIVGALAAIAINVGLVLLAVRCAWRGRKWRDPLLIAAGLAMGGYLVQGMVNNLFEVGATSALLALVVGAFAAGTDAGEPTGGGSPRAPDAAPLGS